MSVRKIIPKYSQLLASENYVPINELFSGYFTPPMVKRIV